MNRTLSEWASIAEIVASVAVVVTLIMLLIGVRENTAVVRANSYNDLLSNVDQQAHVIVQDARLTRIWRFYNAGTRQDFTDEERFTLLLLLRSTYRTFEKAYFAYLYGTVGRTEYARFDEQACNHFEKPGSDLWREVREVLTTEFRRHVEDLCAQPIEADVK